MSLIGPFSTALGDLPGIAEVG